MPFHGVAHVGYIPSTSGRVTGLSKIARVADLYARRPQVQERLTAQIADALVRKLEPRGVIVVIDAEHLCMGMRGHPQARLADHHVGGARAVAVLVAVAGGGAVADPERVTRVPAASRCRGPGAAW